MNYIVTINGVPVQWAQTREVADVIAARIGGKVFRSAEVLDAEEDIVVFFGREYVAA